MIENYVTSRKTTYDIAKEIGCSNVTVGYYLKKNNIKTSNQTYKFNEHYFNKIDTANKAYFLGLSYADGCVSPEKNSYRLKLTKEDEYILEEFKKDIGSNKPLYFRKEEIIKGTSYIGKAQSALELNSKILIEDLEKLGVTKNKSLTIKFPTNIPLEFMKDFIRGCFDGDGCIYNSQKRIMLNYSGSEEFCKGLSLWLKKTLDINTIPKQDSRGSSWFLFIRRIGDVLKFCNYIYQDINCLKLSRKYLKFKDYEYRRFNTNYSRKY